MPASEGNVWVRPAPTPGQPPPLPEVQDLKWTEAEVEEYKAGRLPMGKDTDAPWSYGDIEAGFKKAALDPRRNVRDAEHQPSVPREPHVDGVLAERQTVHPPVDSERRADRHVGGALVEHRAGEHRAHQRVLAAAVMGSKGTGSVTDIIPALLAKKTGTPVQMRISREEEHGIGGARPALHGRMKVGFTKEGRVTAIDMYTVVDGGPYGPGATATPPAASRR